MGARGRGSSGRDRGQSGRGRGRGRGRRGMSRNGFDAKRMGQKDSSDSEAEESDSEISHDEEEEEESSSDEDEDQTGSATARAYSVLLSSIRTSKGLAKVAHSRPTDEESNPKRRKLSIPLSDADVETQSYKGDRKDTTASREDISQSSDEDEEDDDVEQDEPVDYNDDDEEDDIIEYDDEDDTVKGPNVVDDPFKAIFAEPDEESVTTKVEAIKQAKWDTSRVSLKSTRMIFNCPISTTAAEVIGGTADEKGAKSDDKLALAPPISGPSAINLKKRLQESPALSNVTAFDDEEQTFSRLLFNYYDMLYCKRTRALGPKLRKLYCLHALNHCLKIHDRVIKNTAKLNQAAAAAAAGVDSGAAGEGGGDSRNTMTRREATNVDIDSVEGNFQDQGFTRPKTLIILPTREACARVVNTLSALLGPDVNVENHKRFQDSFEDREKKFPPGSKPSDFIDLFEGNDDDNFRIGIKLTRKTMKLFCDFYGSDILIASPLGLRMAMNGQAKKKDDSKDKDSKDVKKKTDNQRRKDEAAAAEEAVEDYEYLSSIELVILDQTDALLMQNWEHVTHIFERLNLMPKDTSDWDFNRIRPWYLDRQAPFFRQTVVISQFDTPDLATLFRTSCLSWRGRCRILPSSYPGELQRLNTETKGAVTIRQTFTRFSSLNLTQDPDTRFKYFTATIVPTLSKHHKQKRSRDARARGGAAEEAEAETGTLIFIPSYIDFVRLRNFFATSPAASSVSFGSVSEYTSLSESTRALSHFRTGRHRVLMYTERAHHFRRQVIRGVKKVVMYGLPDNPIFYREIVGGFLGKSEEDGTLGEGDQGLVKVCFSKYDVLKLERIAGSARVGRMVMDTCDVFDFL